jgi:multimeric flavodoxin WrbA
MTKRILIVNGSLRLDGNTDVLLQKLADGAEAAGGHCNYLWLRRLRISDCIGCYTCNETNICSIDDGMTFARSQLELADLIVFGSPVYWCSVTGLMKTFVDRLYYYHGCENGGLLSGKSAVILATVGEIDNTDHETELFFEYFRRALSSLRINILDELSFPAIMEIGAVFNHPDYLRKAFKAGKKATANTVLH